MVIYGGKRDACCVKEIYLGGANKNPFPIVQRFAFRVVAFVFFHSYFSFQNRGK